MRVYGPIYEEKSDENCASGMPDCIFFSLEALESVSKRG